MECFSNLWCSSLFFLISLLICSSSQVVLAQPAYVDSLCTDVQTVAPNSEYQANVNTAISFLSSNTTIWKIFYNTTVGSGANTVYGAFYCRTDLTIAFCQECISLAINSLTTRCRGAIESIVWYDQCYVRYSNESFVGILNDAPMILFRNEQNTAADIQNITSNQTFFTQVLQGTLRDVSSQAATSAREKFATREGKFVANLTSSNTIYTLAECSPAISGNDCSTCLQMIIGNMTELCNMKAACTVICPSCYMRYSIDALSLASGISPAPSVGDTFEEVTPVSKRNNTPLVVGVTISAIFALAILLGTWFFVCKRKFKKAFTEEDEIEIVESLKFDLATLRKATNNFSWDEKLGEGGFGEVYKGKLENGQYIAIKRLSRNSKQGIGEFKTEVALVAKLQHRNLAKLLGFCLSKKEKILVYEFLPNMSLDRFLSDPTKRASLQWGRRFNIIVGIARGLLYLHEDSRLKIVHRDLKPSNILLDEAMNPKIADFGMAKLFGVDQTQDNTDRIVGTFGYMAPEYLIAGYYSVKSDVYGFGIIVLELVSGRRNKFLGQEQNEESLLYQAWSLWNEGIPLQLTDPTLGSDYHVDEVIRCIHVGLLCIQEAAAKRPEMATIVSLLNGESITLPSPTPPCFLTGSADNIVKKVGVDYCPPTSVVMEDFTEMYPR